MVQAGERVDDYVLGRTLGEGAQGLVKECRNPQGQAFAIKICCHSNQNFDRQAFQRLVQEFQSNSLVQHANVVRYLDFEGNGNWFRDDGTSEPVAYVVMELVTRGELFDIVASTGAFEEKFCKYMFRQLLQGLNAIHQRGYSHRDLKPENVLVDSNFNLKICDFGFARELEGRNQSGFQQTVVGTIGYMAPEIIDRQPYQGESVDLFAAATILFILRKAAPPFRTTKKTDPNYRLMIENRVEHFWRTHSQHFSPHYYSENFIALLTSMLHPNPEMRLCLADVVGHPWLRSGIATDQEYQAELGRRWAAMNPAPQNPPAVPQGGVQGGPNQVFLSGAEGDQADEQASGRFASMKQNVEAFDPAMRHANAFYSKSQPALIAQKIDEYLKSQGVEAIFSDTTWKLSFQVLSPVEVDPDMPREETVQFVESVNIEAQISRMPCAQDFFCVDFRKKSGSSLLFHGKIAGIREHMTDYITEQ